MNEQRFAHRVRQALDESAERLPYRITQRLERARHAALAHALSAQHAPVTAAGPALTLGDPRPPLLLRLLSTLAPILLVVAGLYGISVWEDAQRTADTADIDARLLLADDDVPISAYADRGFGVYIQNVRQ